MARDIKLDFGYLAGADLSGATLRGADLSNTEIIPAARVSNAEIIPAARVSNADQIRTKFETRNPLPDGVHWDGDHYNGNRSVIGSFSNASIWNDMLRGYLQGYSDALLGELK